MIGVNGRKQDGNLNKPGVVMGVHLQPPCSDEGNLLQGNRNSFHVLQNKSLARFMQSVVRANCMYNVGCIASTARNTYVPKERIVGIDTGWEKYGKLLSI
jgi:hypothetical protein